jgi:guanosine-3',5'-bis(diphosphate) 3'-pyrophosphohydrolase
MHTALILHAARFATEKHQGQRRKNAEGSPYIYHPLEVALVLAAEGDIENPELLAAALLHDTIEDTATTFAELSALFGDRIAGIVQEVSDDKSLPKEVRKEEQVRKAPSLSPEAKTLKLADKICNLRDILTSPPADWPLARKQAYFDWAKRVGAGLRGVHPALETLFDETLARRKELA